MDRGAWQATVHWSHRVGHDWATNTFTSLSMCSRLVGCRLHTCFYQIAWQSHYILYSIKIWQPSLTLLIYLSKLMEAKPAFMCLLGANIKTLLVRWFLPKCFILYTWNFLGEQILNFLTTHTHTHNGNYVEVKNKICSLTVVIFPQGTHILKH